MPEVLAYRLVTFSFVEEAPLADTTGHGMCKARRRTSIHKRVSCVRILLLLVASNSRKLI